MKVLSILTICLICMVSNAQDTLTGPHLGRIKVSKGYHIESVGCDNYLEIYLFNEDMQPVFNSGITGDVLFYYDNGAGRSKLVPYGIDGFTAHIESPEFTKYKVTLDLLEELILSADFMNECTAPVR